MSSRFAAAIVTEVAATAGASSATTGIGLAYATGSGPDPASLDVLAYAMSTVVDLGPISTAELAAAAKSNETNFEFTAFDFASVLLDRSHHFRESAAH